MSHEFPQNDEARAAGEKSERILEDTYLSGAVGMGAAGPRLSASALRGAADDGAGIQVREDHSWKSHAIEEGRRRRRAGGPRRRPASHPAPLVRTLISRRPQAQQQGTARLGERAGRAVDRPGRTGSHFRGELSQPVVTEVQANATESTLPANAVLPASCKGKVSAMR